jgi:hypothetical protein
MSRWVSLNHARANASANSAGFWWKRREIRRFLWVPGRRLPIARSAGQAIRIATRRGGSIAIWPSRAAAIGKAATFGRGRDLAAWLGLVPKQMTTGGKPKLLGINKRGNVYLRKMLIHGARAAMPTLSKGETPLGSWLRGLLARAHANTVVVALAAKLARIVCEVLHSGKRFEIRAAMAA